MEPQMFFLRTGKDDTVSYRIVIPVLNQLNYTKGCIASLAASLTPAESRLIRFFVVIYSELSTAEEPSPAEQPAPAEQPISFGLYACSPLASSFEAIFDNFKLEPCLWKAHE